METNNSANNFNAIKIAELRHWADHHEQLEPYLWIFYILGIVLILVVLAFFVLSIGTKKNDDSDSDSESESESDNINASEKFPKNLADK